MTAPSERTLPGLDEINKMKVSAIIDQKEGPISVYWMQLLGSHPEMQALERGNPDSNVYAQRYSELYDPDTGLELGKKMVKALKAHMIARGYEKSFQDAVVWFLRVLRKRAVNKGCNDRQRMDWLNYAQGESDWNLSSVKPVKKSKQQENAERFAQQLEAANIRPENLTPLELEVQTRRFLDHYEGEKKKMGIDLVAYLKSQKVDDKQIKAVRQSRAEHNRLLYNKTYNALRPSIRRSKASKVTIQADDQLDNSILSSGASHATEDDEKGATPNCFPLHHSGHPSFVDVHATLNSMHPESLHSFQTAAPAVNSLKGKEVLHARSAPILYGTPLYDMYAPVVATDLRGQHSSRDLDSEHDSVDPMYRELYQIFKPTHRQHNTGLSSHYDPTTQVHSSSSPSVSGRRADLCISPPPSLHEEASTSYMPTLHHSTTHLLHHPNNSSTAPPFLYDFAPSTPTHTGTGPH
ncbi:hypothetical protein CBS101457_003124 [Exobasidium rhododendri]|nr:hypothetical protein CBS101457_003124 [Exobasidium rhododendri]